MQTGLSEKYDKAHEATLDLLDFLRRELLLWFGIMMLSLVVLATALYLYDNANSVDLSRDFVAVDRAGKYLTPTSLRKPSHLNIDEIENWVTESLEFCMSFDWQSYGYISSQCNSTVFSSNTVPDEFISRGAHFQMQLRNSNILNTLLDNRTSMNIEIESAKFVGEGIRTYERGIFKQNEGWKNVPDTRYIYEFEYVFRIKMIGQKLDAPIRYQVLVERTSELLRWHGLAMRSVLSLE
ncbi:hypothetical protein [Vibrio nigripulchritudo]|uniref:hypothetical protein n=1 Tax=Vibrio nigripulchritudo TaxID=28173 RepID=UPI0005719D44|nr:hypothetical protein [Vibrio nigripulchritudo]